MKITFIRLNMFEYIGSDAMKPLLFGIIKKLTPPECEIEFIDERVEPLPDTICSDVIAFSVETYTAKRAYILARKYKTDRNLIVMGGFHASVMPDEILQHADTVLIGDAEDTWGPFVRDCLSGKPQKYYRSSELCDLTSGAMIALFTGIGITESAFVRSREVANSIANSVRLRQYISMSAESLPTRFLRN